MRALVLEGGAMRGIFTAGVLDAMAERGEPPFDLVVGVSAGACCAASHLAGQLRRNYVVFLEYMTRKEFVDPLRPLRGGSLVDMAYLRSPVADSLYPLDMAALRRAKTRLEAVATDAETGASCYLPVQDGDDGDGWDALHATVAVPLVYNAAPVRFRGRRYFDGALTDPVPVRRALELGATELTVVLTRPRGFRAKPQSPIIKALARRGLKPFPEIIRWIDVYDQTSNGARAFLEQPPEVPTRVLMPPDDYPINRFTSDRASLHRGYQMGCRAVALGGFWL